MPQLLDGAIFHFHGRKQKTTVPGRGRILARFEKDLTHVVSTKEDNTPHLEIMRKVNCASQHLGSLNQTCLTDLTVAQAVFLNILYNLI